MRITAAKAMNRNPKMTHNTRHFAISRLRARTFTSAPRPDDIVVETVIEVIRGEITEIPEDAITVIATGPLTSDALAEKIHALNGGDGFYFYDAAAPIVDSSTINMDLVYLKSRYDKGEAAYLNAPMNKEQFTAFYEALISAEEAPLNSFEKEKYFEADQKEYEKGVTHFYNLYFVKQSL